MAPFKILSGKFKGTFTQFNPTPPSQRLVKTFGEVQSFKRQLLLAEQGLQNHAKATADLVKLIDETITAFPRVWSRSDDGVSAQLHEEDHLKPEPGNNKIVSYPSNSFRQSLDNDLREEVYQPIEKWHFRYREVKGRISEVETARLEYDRARQRLAEAHKHALKAAAKNDAQGGIQNDVTIRQAEGALTATRDEYVRIEEAVHVELAVLVMDAQNALDYVTRALTLSSRALLDIATHHQQETVKTLPMLVTESSGPLLLGPASPMATAGPPTPLALGAPPSRTTSNLGSPNSMPGTPVISTGGSPSPLGMSQGHGFMHSPAGVPPTTPEQPSFESAGNQAAPGGYQVVKETLVVQPTSGGNMAPVTPVKEVVVNSPEQGGQMGGQMGGQTGGQTAGQMGSTGHQTNSEVDTPFVVNSESGFDNKRKEFLQQHA